MNLQFLSNIVAVSWLLHCWQTFDLWWIHQWFCVPRCGNTQELGGTIVLIIDLLTCRRWSRIRVLMISDWGKWKICLDIACLCGVKQAVQHQRFNFFSPILWFFSPSLSVWCFLQFQCSPIVWTPTPAARHMVQHCFVLLSAINGFALCPCVFTMHCHRFTYG